MNKYLISAALFLMCQAGFSQNNYSITIDGQNFDISLNNQFTYISESGDSIQFELTRTGEVAIQQVQQQEPVVQDFTTKGDDKTFDDIFLNFQYPENFAIAKTRPSNDMQQITMVNGSGGGIIIQEFLGLNPASLVDFFLGGLVGVDKVANAQTASLNASNGTQLSGKTALDSDGNTISVYSHGQNQKGFMIALIGDTNSDELLKKFVNTITVK